MLERRQGKGTFVATKRVPMQMMSLDDVAKGFYDNPLGRRHTRVLSKKEYTASQYERSMLGLAQGELVHVFTRLMLLDGELLMLDRSVYPASRYPGFFDKVVDDVSTYRILREEYGVRMHRSHKEISHTYASSEQARQMGCAIGTPLFKMFKVVYDSHDAPIHMSSSYLPADGIIFIADREL